jgi:hypothetical protein
MRPRQVRVGPTGNEPDPIPADPKVISLVWSVAWQLFIVQWLGSAGLVIIGGIFWQSDLKTAIVKDVKVMLLEESNALRNEIHEIDKKYATVMSQTVLLDPPMTDAAAILQLARDRERLERMRREREQEEGNE